MTELLLRDVRAWPRLPGSDALDVRCRDGQVVEIGPAGSSDAGDADVVEGGGAVLLPSFTDAHAHLDSTRLGLPFRPHDAEPGLAGLVAADRRGQHAEPVPVAERATHTLGRTIALGTTRVRSHAQVDADFGLARLEGVLAAREAHADRAEVQVVAFPQAGILRSPGTADLLDAAVRAGADLVGGLDPAGFDLDPTGHLDVVFGIAERRGVGVDLHLHDGGELGAWQLERICDRAEALSMQGMVTVSHAFGLAMVDADRQQALVERLTTVDVALTTVAPGARPPLPRRLLADAGVRVGLGQDGIRDFWSPWGNGDMLERTWQLAHREGLRRDDEVEACVELATLGGRAVLDAGLRDLPGRGVGVGAPADLVLVDAGTVTSAVMDRPSARTVVRAGRVVAVDGELV